MSPYTRAAGGFRGTREPLEGADGGDQVGGGTRRVHHRWGGEGRRRTRRVHHHHQAGRRARVHAVAAQPHGELGRRGVQGREVRLQHRAAVAVALLLRVLR
jgi:hypothetical protein